MRVANAERKGVWQKEFAGLSLSPFVTHSMKVHNLICIEIFIHTRKQIWKYEYNDCKKGRKRYDLEYNIIGPPFPYKITKYIHMT